MISEQAARKIIRDNLKPGPGERVPLPDALGRALAADVKAPSDFPPFSCSAFDGYALRADDVSPATRTNPLELQIAGIAVAGQMPQVSLRRRQAVRIMTGAPLPRGADAVVKQEDAEADGNCLRLANPIKRGEGVLPKGYEAKKGEKAICKGSIIGPEEIGFLASLGVEQVKVYARPRVALFMIGDELVTPGGVLPPGKIRTGNALMLRSLILKYGGLPVNLGIVPDSEEKIVSAMRRAAEAEIALSSGGSGRGVHDLTARAFASAGGRFLFQGVSIWPGGTLSLGLLKGTPLFMLPGGPRTSSLCFHLFVREALRVMCPTERNFSMEVSATMLNSLRGRAGVDNYLHVSLRKGRSGYYAVRSRTARPAESRCALAVLPPDVDRVGRGDKVRVILV